MPIKYEDHQTLESEEGSPKFRNGSRLLQPFQQRICYGSQLHLLLLGLGLLLLVIICVFGCQITKLQRDLLTLRTTSLNLSSSTAAEIQALNSQAPCDPDGRFQGAVTSLQSELKEHKQLLQAGQGLKNKLLTLESNLEKEKQDLKAVHDIIILAIQHHAAELQSLTCQMTALKRNASRSTCCPMNWVEHRGSCYWFSQTGKSWQEAQQYCQMENSYLVVVNSQEEQNFIQHRTGTLNTWMGLMDEHGPWKWEDGTDYETGFKNWSPKQPDNFEGHGLGGGEDCAHFTENGEWNDNVCQRLFHWVCETRLTEAS
ncbi:asialoglycoprotein receptor 1 [Echinops telfairi]|uniref:Asialoglycoprotein receptor 1 n=1 Tax=Echinops telfairi TaxID=9371 RepID=A0AC55DC85_ECHTE|nr:asialoglycoprotein receptor 1 [Echinops telfairi]